MEQATGGTFTIAATVNGQTETTGSLAYDANAAEVENALNNLAGVSVTVTGAGTQGDPWIITGLPSSVTTNDNALTGTNPATRDCRRAADVVEQRQWRHLHHHRVHRQQS